jgi:16S rRNA (uracil1498-N3)-methyltransferase
MRRFYAPGTSFSGDNVLLDASETSHLRDVLRLRPGDGVRVFDGDGREFECEIESIEKRAARLRLIGEVAPAAPESGFELTLATAFLKGEKSDLVIQKATELGVSKLVPLVTKRCEVRIKNYENRLQRWRKIAMEATKQCGRAKVMSVEMPVDLSDFVTNLSAISEGEMRILFAEENGQPFSVSNSVSRMTALVGPEGGWEKSEIELAEKAGFQIVTFGGRIMKADTAAIAITAILQHRFGDMN